MFVESVLKEREREREKEIADSEGTVINKMCLYLCRFLRIVVANVIDFDLTLSHRSLFWCLHSWRSLPSPRLLPLMRPLGAGGLYFSNVSPPQHMHTHLHRSLSKLKQPRKHLLTVCSLSGTGKGSDVY